MKGGAVMEIHSMTIGNVQGLQGFELERATRFELATKSLGSFYSTN